MAALTDFHSHILPGIDDGSRSTEESLAMLRMSAEQGTGCIFATPHFYPRYDDPERFLARRQAATEQLRAAMKEETGLPGLRLGAEVYYFSGMSDSEVLPRLTMEEMPCILIEMPPAPWTPPMYRELEWVYTKQGLVPIIAHLDRYISPLNSHGIPRRLEELPVMVQANASFFLRRSTASYALGLLKQDRIHLLGSDCHNLTDRAPNLGPAAQVIRQRLGWPAIKRIQQRERELLSPDCEKEHFFQEVRI